MLVLDADRRQYLANRAAVMKTNALLLMLGELCKEDAYNGTIRTMESKMPNHFLRSAASCNVRLGRIPERKKGIVEFSV